MDKYFITSEEDKKKVRSLYNVDDDALKIKIQFLRDWVNKCPHIPLECKDEEFLDLMLLRGKFKEEIVKTNIENYYKTIIKYDFGFKGLGRFVPTQELGIAVTMPKPTTNWERVLILKVDLDKLTEDIDKFRGVAYAVATGLIMFHKDYLPSVRTVVDCTGVTMNHILSVDINQGIRDVYKLLELHEKVIKGRIAGVEVLNAHHLLSFCMRYAKIILKAKLFKKITIHENLASLHKNVDPQYLPVEYGGTLPSVEEHRRAWDQIFRDQQSVFEKVDRITEAASKDDDTFCPQGTFKTLSID